LLLALGFLSLMGCYSDDDEDRHSYYQFNEADKALLIKYDYTVDRIITYENQFEEQVHLKVLVNEIKKQPYYTRGTFSGGGGDLSHYYDNQIIRFEVVENPSAEIYGSVNYIFSKNFDRLENGINFPMWNVLESYFLDEIENAMNIVTTGYNTVEKIQLNSNGHVFKNVVMLTSDSDESLENGTFGVVPNDINLIYYDYDFGVVQFNGVDGKIWKVIYP